MSRRLLSLVLLLATVGSTEAAFRAGIATKDVTPNPLLPVSGGVGPSHAATVRNGDLRVRALVLEQDGTRVAFVSVDFLGFPKVLGDRIRALVPSIPGTNILIGATHTHSAPDCYGFPDGKGGTAADLPYLDRLVKDAAATIREAVDHLRPAGLRIASGEAKGKIAYNYYAPDLYDPRCGVIQCVDTDGKPFATLVNYAVHPEVIGSSRGICSPDIIGPLCDRIAEKGGGTGIFMNSAQGGMVTADNRRPGGGEANDWEECQRIGRVLGDEVLRIAADAPIDTDPGLRVFARPISFPIESPRLLAVLKSSPLGLKTDDDGRVSTTLNVVNLGKAQIVSIPGEALPNIGYYLKRKMRGQPNLLFGLTNDSFGYILTRVDFGSFERYGYVSQVSLGEQTGEILMDAVLKFVNDIPKPGER